VSVGIVCFPLGDSVHMTEFETVRCAEWSRENALDPIATIGNLRSYLLVDVPLPWPRDVGELESLAPLRPILVAENGRLQAVAVPRESTLCRIALYRSWDPTFSSYTLSETIVPFCDVVSSATELLVAKERTSETVPLQRRTEVLVCTHGRRDRCCGSLGTALFLELQADADRHLRGTRIRRTSHTGGHRFAPTALVFPEGTGWAFCDLELIDRVVHRRSPISNVLPYYRGCAGLNSRGAQALERVVLAEMGWKLFDLKRSGRDEGDGCFSLSVDWPSGQRATWSGDVVNGRELPVPECGGTLNDARKTEVELIVQKVWRSD
jgi:hypothetical protein